MPELIPIFLFVVMGGVLIMRPVTKKLGLLIEALATERMAQVKGAPALEDAQLIRLTAAMESLSDRMDRIDDRLGFMERLIDERPRSRLTG